LKELEGNLQERRHLLRVLGVADELTEKEHSTEGVVTGYDMRLEDPRR